MPTLGVDVWVHGGNKCGSMPESDAEVCEYQVRSVLGRGMYDYEEYDYQGPRIKSLQTPFTAIDMEWICKVSKHWSLCGCNL